MRILNSLYPYPVLSSNGDDYKSDSKFSIDYELIPATSFKKAKLIANFRLIDEELEELIDKGKAEFYVHIESSRSVYRDLRIVKNRKAEIEINPDYMRTSVEITGFLLAKDSLLNFTNKNINSDIYGTSYTFPNLNSGDPLAVSFTIEVNIEEKDDFSKISSIIKVARTQDQYMKIDYDQDTIFVFLPEKQYQSYLNYSNVFGETILTTIIQSTLIYVIDAIIKNKGEGMQDRNWYSVIEKKIEQLGYSMSQLLNEDISSVKLAQEILNNPLERMFEELEGVVKEHE